MAAVLSQQVELGQRATTWRRLLRRSGALLGLSVVVFFVLIAVLAPWIAPFDPLATSWSEVRGAPSAAHLFGSDELGRDVLSRIIWGARASILAGVVSVSISLGLGVPIGMTAGYLGRWADALISRITDAMLACPFLILAIALAAFLGPSLTNAMIAIGISATPVFIRLTRAQVLAAKSEDYVEAARARQPAPAHRAAPHPAEHRGAAHRAGDPRDRRSRHRRGQFVFLGLRTTTTGSKLGKHA